MNNIELEDNHSSQAIDIKEIYYVLITNFKLVTFILFISLIIGILITSISTPLYKASGTVLVESNSTPFSLFTDFGSSASSSSIDNEIAILTSKQTMNRTLQRFINEELHNDMFLFNTKQYEHKALSKFLRKILFVDYFQVKEPIDINDTNRMNKLIKHMRNSISVFSKRNSDVIELSILSQSPYEASRIINYLIGSYQNMDKEWSNGEMIHMKSFLDSQIKIKEKELENLELKLSDFQKREQIYGLSGNSELLLNQLTLVEADFHSNKVQYNILKERRAYIENELTEEEKMLTKKVMNTINERLFALKTEIAQRESDLISTIALQGEEHQAVLSGEKSLKKLKNKLEEETKKLIDQGISVADPIEYRQSLMDTLLNITAQEALYISKSNELEKIIRKYEYELSELPDKSLEFARLERDKNILSETYALMMRKREEAKIGEASKLGKIRIVDIAYPDSKPVKPRKVVIILLSLIIGGFISLILCFLKEYLDNSVKSISEIERYGLDIIGMVPTIGQEYKKDSDKNNIKENKNLERRLITREDSKSPVSEAYRTLRTNLMYRFNDDSLGQAILVSSPGPGEGKTTTISNLAITFANLGKKTLLVDTDLRKPVMHIVFDKEQINGLTDYLRGSEDNIENLISEVEGIENLNIMTSGNVPPFPSELLGSEKMDNLIHELKKQWDIVLFDLPPLMAVTDAYVILKKMDQFLFVLRAGVTQKGALKRALSYLQGANIAQVGAVLNQVDKTKTSKEEHFDYYADYYGHEEE